MSVESGVFSILSSSEDLAVAMGVTLDGVAGNIRRAGAAVDLETPALVVKWEETPMFGNLGTYSFTLRAHDRDESYDRISAMLDAAKATLTAVVHQSGITQIDWKARSGDLVDDGYKTLTKYDTYVVAAGLATRGE